MKTGIPVPTPYTPNPGDVFYNYSPTKFRFKNLVVEIKNNYVFSRFSDKEDGDFSDISSRWFTLTEEAINNWDGFTYVPARRRPLYIKL